MKTRFYIKASIFFLLILIQLPVYSATLELGQMLITDPANTVLGENPLIEDLLPAPESAIAQRLAVDDNYQVRIIYMIPSNRSPQPGAEEILQQYVLRMHQWFSDHMELLGYGPKTFQYETEADGITPRINIVNVAQPDTYFHVDYLQTWINVQTAIANAGYPAWQKGEVFLVIPEIHVQLADGRLLEGSTFYGGTGINFSGLGMVSGDALARFPESFLIDDRFYSGLLIPEVGPFPLVQSVTFPSMEGTTLSSTSSSAQGAGMHEFAHGLSLPHDFRNDVNFNGNLIGNGLRGLRGSLFPEHYPDDGMRLSPASALQLNYNRFFNSIQTFSEDIPPSVDILSGGTVVPEDGLCKIDFTAMDSDSSLAGAVLTRAGNAVAELPLDGQQVTTTISTYDYIPGVEDEWQLTVFDSQGNRTLTSRKLITCVTGLNRAPIPFIKVSRSAIIPGEDVLLDAFNSIDPDGNNSQLKVEWDLDGDGVFDTSPTTVMTHNAIYLEPGIYQISARLTDDLGDSSVSIPIGIKVEQSASPSEDLTTWETLNGIEVVTQVDDSYQLIHPGTNWPILRKDLPVIPAGAQLKISFTGKSAPGGARLHIRPWELAATGGGHIYLSTIESDYERIYTNTTGADLTDAQLLFYFADSQTTGVGQTIDISNLKLEFVTHEPIEVLTYFVCEYVDEADTCFAPYIGTELYIQAWDIENVLENFSWDFGDGTNETGNDRDVTHIYNEAGTYTVTITASTNETPPRTAEFTQEITVRPIIEGSVDVEMDVTNTDYTTITYDLVFSTDLGDPAWIGIDRFSTGECYFNVDYGDGTSHSAYWNYFPEDVYDYGLDDVVHTYSAPGTYEVTITVTCETSEYGDNPPYPSPSTTVTQQVTVGEQTSVIEDLTTWDRLNGMEVVSLGDDEYLLTHPGTNWPILKKELPVIPAGAQLNVSFTGSSSPAGARLHIKPWDLAATGGGHIYLSDTEENYQRSYTNNSGTDLTDAEILFYFDDSLASGAGQTINIDNLNIEVISEGQRLIPTDDANNRASLDGLLAVSKWEHAFMRFDGNQIQETVSKATLRLYHYGGNVPLTLSVGGIYDDNWTESTNTPALTYFHLNPDAVLASTEVIEAGFVELDVTDFVLSQVSGDGIISLEIASNQNTWTLLSSKEGSYVPELVVETGALISEIERISVSSDGVEGNDESFVTRWHGSNIISRDERFVVFHSYANNLFDVDIQDRDRDIFIRDLTTQETFRINTTIDGNEINGESYSPTISRDGRFVAFSSSANNLVANDTNNNLDVFVYDIETNTVERVSVSSNGIQGNSSSYAMSINTDGRFVTFWSYSDNLVANDNNNSTELFIHDRITKETNRVCFSSETHVHDICSGGALSGDGRYVVFQSAASDLVENDTNGANDIFIYDREKQETSLVSVSSDEIQGQTGSFNPAISENGQFITFVSGANDLVGDDANNTSNVFVHDRSNGATSRVSDLNYEGDYIAYTRDPGISANGRFVTYISNMVDDEASKYFDIFIYDSINDETIKIEIDEHIGFEGILSPKISPDGNYVIFSSRNRELVENDTNLTADVFIAPVNFQR